MKRCLTILLLTLVVSSTSAKADFLVEGFTATDYNTTSNWNGFGFSPVNNIDVTGFAVVDIGTLGLAGNATVGLWSVNPAGTAVTLISELDFAAGTTETLVSTAAVPSWTTSGIASGEELNGFRVKELGSSVALTGGSNYIIGVAPTTNTDVSIPYYQQVTGSSPPLSNLDITINAGFNLLSGAAVIPSFNGNSNSSDSFGLSGTPPSTPPGARATSDPTQSFPGSSTESLFNPIVVNLVTGDFEDLPEEPEDPIVPEPSSVILMTFALIISALLIRRKSLVVTA